MHVLHLGQLDMFGSRTNNLNMPPRHYIKQLHEQGTQAAPVVLQSPWGWAVLPSSTSVNPIPPHPNLNNPLHPIMFDVKAKDDAYFEVNYFISSSLNHPVFLWIDSEGQA